MELRLLTKLWWPSHVHNGWCRFLTVLPLWKFLSSFFAVYWRQLAGCNTKLRLLQWLLDLGAGKTLADRDWVCLRTFLGTNTSRQLGSLSTALCPSHVWAFLKFLLGDFSSVHRGSLWHTLGLQHRIGKQNYLGEALSVLRYHVYTNRAWRWTKLFGEDRWHFQNGNGFMITVTK